ncbi:MAG: hypothetical protein AAF363_21930 [Bacteroidota bacterium]
MLRNSEGIKGVLDFERRMNTFFNLLVGPSLLAFIILYLEFKVSESSVSAETGINAFLIGALVVIILFFAEFQFRREVQLILREMDLREKMNLYLPIYQKRGIISVLSIIIILVALFLEKQSIYTLLFFVSFGYLSLVRPSQRKLSKHLKFTKKDIEMMESYTEFNNS